MNAPRLPFGTAMALAERNLRGPLIRILTEEDLEPGAWFTLNALGLRGGTSTTTVKELLFSSGYDDPSVDAWLLRASPPTDSSRTATSSSASRPQEPSATRPSLTGSARSPVGYSASSMRPGSETARALLQQIAETDQATIDAAAFEDAPA